MVRLLDTFLVRCIATVLAVITLYLPYSAHASLAAQWHFNEDAWNGTAGEIKDSSGQGYNMSLVSNGGYPSNALTAPAITGDPGTCRYGVFDGANDGYATVSDPGVNSNLDLMNNFTVAMWINLDVIPSDHVFAMEKGAGFALELTPYGSVEAWLKIDGYFKYIDTPRDTFSVGTWVHLALTFTSGQQYLYINGAMVRSSAHVGTLADNSDPLNIGSISWASEYFDGSMDEVHIYQSVLSGAEISALMNSTQPCTALTPSPEPTLVGEWRFDESVWDGTAGEVKDSSGQGYNMSLVSNGGYPSNALTAPAITGDPGTCRYGVFDGANDGYATVSDPGINSNLDLMNNFTVAMWINLDVIPSDHVFAMEKGAGFALELTPYGTVEAWLKIDGSFQYLDTGNVFSVGTWVHLAFTFTSGQQYLYINGAVAGSSTHVGSLADTSDPVNIASMSWASEYFNGSIDEVYMYQGVLDATEVSTLMNTTRPCSVSSPEPTLVGEWRLDETVAYSGIANEVLDSSGNGLHGAANTVNPPTTSFANPVTAGSPSQCRYAEFVEGVTKNILVTDNDALDFAVGDEITLMAWVYPTAASLAIDAVLLEKSNNYMLYLETDLAIKLWVYGDADQKVWSSTKLPVNTWSHVAVTFKDGEQKIYINGMLDNSASRSLAGAAGNTEMFKIGDGTQDLGANVDEVRFYRGLLTASDISAAMNETRACPAGTEPVALVAQWNFDELSWDGSLGGILDSSGNNYHATVVLDGVLGPNTANTDPVVAGGTGTCHYGVFDDNDGSYIELVDPGDSSVFDMGPSDSYSIAAWVRLDTEPTSRGQILRKGKNYRFYVENDKILTLQWSMNDIEYFVAADSHILNLDTWYHVAATVTPDEQKLYINGALVKTANIAIVATQTNNAKVTLGDSLSGNASGFEGAIDEVRLFRGALNIDEINNLKNQTRTCPVEAAVLIAEWRFDEPLWNGTEGEVLDSAGAHPATSTLKGDYPTTELATPALGASVGTCRYAQFNGAQDGVITLDDPGNNSDFDQLSLSVSFWLNPSAFPVSDFHTVWAKGDSFDVLLTPSQTVRLSWFDSVAWHNLASTTVLPANTWTHVALTFTNGAQKLYINGVLDNSSGFAMDMKNNNATIFLGGDDLIDSRSLDGLLDEFRFYSGVLQASEVAAIYTDTRPCPAGSMTELIAQWRLDALSWDGTANEVQDSSTNGYHGAANSAETPPVTANETPVVAGDTGTCRYGVFEASTNTELVIPDPGTDSDFDFDDSDAYSMAAWVYLDGEPALPGTVLRKNNNYQLLISDAKKVVLSWGDQGGPQTLKGDIALAINTWHHIAVTVTPSARTIYVDGVQDVVSAQTVNGVETDDSPIMIGGKEAGLSAYDFNGYIDEVNLYRGELTASQINTLKNDVRTCPDEPAALIAEWRFDEFVWNGSAGEVRDSSPNELHGTAEAGVTPTTHNVNPALSGAVGTCGYGEFLAEGNTKIDVADPGIESVLDMSENDSLSISAWVNIDPAASQAGFIVRKHDNYRLLVETDNTIGFRWKDSGTNFQFNSTTALTRGEWYHVAVVIKPNLRTIYINGVADATDTRIAVDLLETDFPLYIGGIADGGGDTYGFYGLLDELRIYQGALTSAQVSELMTQSRTCPQTADSLVAQWSFEQWEYNGTAGELLDSTSNALHADGITGGTALYPPTSSVNPAIDGSPGTCRYFDGSRSNGAFTLLDPGNDSALDAKSYTISAWVKLKASGGVDSAILTKGGNYSLRVTGEGGLSNWLWDTYSSAWVGHESAPGLLTVGTWHHVAATYTDGEQNYYVDGVLAQSLALASSPDITNNEVYIGTNFDNSRLANVALDELRLYNRVLNASEVNAVMGETRACATLADYLVAEWRFDEDEQWRAVANEMKDSASQSLHGVAVNDGGVPQRAFTSPAVGTVGAGTCAYADFSTNDGYFSIADPGPNSPLDMATEYSIVLWARPHEHPGANATNLYSKNTQGELRLVKNTGQLAYFWRHDGDWYNVKTPNAVALNTWQHIAATYKNGSQKIYIDGVEIVAQTHTGGVEVNDTAILVGRDDGALDTFVGDIDELRLYSKALTAEHIQSVMSDTRTCSTAYLPASIEVSSLSTASTCAPHAITVSIKNDSGNIITDYVGTVTLNTSTGHGDWATTGIAGDAYGSLSVGSSDSGTATYTFSADDKGSVTLHLANPRSESLTVAVVESLAGATGVSSAIGFTTNTFELTFLSHGNRTVGLPGIWRLDMLSVDPDTGSCSVNNTYNQTNIKIWLDRRDGDGGGAVPTVVDNNSGSTATVVDSEPASNNFNLTFVNGSAQFTLYTTDVIRFRLRVADDSLSFAQTVLSDSADDQNYTPFGYFVSVSGNPSATTAAGAKFKDAGSPFSVTVSAVAWQAEDDLDGNTIPDGHNTAGLSTRADLSNNPVIASIGSENPPESITLTASLLLPAGGNNPGLQDAAGGNGHIITQFSQGTGSADTLYFDEVGIIEIKAEVTDGKYFSKTADKTATSQSYSQPVGRFSAAKFMFNSGTLASACTTGLDFAYMEQNFTGEFTFTPQSKNNNTLQNYHSGFNKLTIGDFEFYARDNNTGALLTDRLAATVNSLSWSGSTGTANATFNIARASAPDGPYTTVGVSTYFNDMDNSNLKNASKNTDGDGDGSAESALIEATELRFGRLRLGDAHGPETYRLNVPLVVEYWQNPDWLINEDDSCTVLPLTAIHYPSGTANASANRTVTLGGGSTVGQYAGLGAGVVPFIAGEIEHSFSAPGVGNVGSFNTFIDLTTFPWLQYDWNADGSYTDSQTPDNHVNFGSYRGHDRMIFWQEY